MALKVFYAWQSDRALRLCKNFIRQALDEAAAKIGKDLSIEEAERQILIDQDTQGVPGSPAVADVILEKIRTADIFIGDLTFIDEMNGRSPGDTGIPNPNVMLEYGYALHALGDRRIIAVMNSSYGAPDKLPFDLSHKRWPICYSAINVDDTSEGQVGRREVRKKLAISLATALRSFLTGFPDEPVIARAEYKPVAMADGLGRLCPDGEVLCVRDQLLPTDDNREIRLKSGPYLYLRVIPKFVQGALSVVDARSLMQGKLQPLAAARSSAGWSTGRNERGAVGFYTIDSDLGTAWTAAELFLSKEIWGIDLYHVNPDLPKRTGLTAPYIPTGAVEEVFVDGLINFLEVASENLRLDLPLTVETGIAGVKNYRLAVDYKCFDSNIIGMILKENITYNTELNQWGLDVYEILKPFFEEIYDAAGEKRPDVRSTSRRLR